MENIDELNQAIRETISWYEERLQEIELESLPNESFTFQGLITVLLSLQNMQEYQYFKPNLLNLFQIDGFESAEVKELITFCNITMELLFGEGATSDEALEHFKKADSRSRLPFSQAILPLNEKDQKNISTEISNGIKNYLIRQQKFYMEMNPRVYVGSSPSRGSLKLYEVLNFEIKKKKTQEVGAENQSMQIVSSSELHLDLNFINMKSKESSPLIEETKEQETESKFFGQMAEKELTFPKLSNATAHQNLNSDFQKYEPQHSKKYLNQEAKLKTRSGQK